jgi:hypothetical protein
MGKEVTSPSEQNFTDIDNAEWSGFKNFRCALTDAHLLLNRVPDTQIGQNLDEPT